MYIQMPKFDLGRSMAIPPTLQNIVIGRRLVMTVSVQSLRVQIVGENLDGIREIVKMVSSA
jgi:hypothetical protein